MKDVCVERIMINNHLLKCSQKKKVLSLFTIEIFLCLASEMYKVSNGLSPPIVSNIFKQKDCQPYNLRLDSQFSRPLVRSVFHETQSISYLGPVIWDILLDSYKNLPNFSVFKNRIKKWKPENCPCRLCKTYISIVGFTQAFAPVSWMKRWYFSHSCLYQRKLVFKFLTFMLIIKFIAFQFYIKQLIPISMFIL